MLRMSARTVNASIWLPEPFATPVHHFWMLAGKSNHSDLFRGILMIFWYVYSRFHIVSNATRVRMCAQHVRVASDAICLMYTASHTSVVCFPISVLEASGLSDHLLFSVLEALWQAFSLSAALSF